MKNRVAEVNRALRARGVTDTKLVRGRGYYYFDGAALAWPSSSVMVYRASDLPVERWIEEFENLRKNAERGTV